MRAFCPALCFCFLPVKYYVPPKTMDILARHWHSIFGLYSQNFCIYQYNELHAVISILCKGYPCILNMVHPSIWGVQGSPLPISISMLRVSSCPPCGSKVAPCKWSPMSGSLISTHRWLTLAFSISGRGYFTRYSFSRGFNPSFYLTLPRRKLFLFSD